MEHGIEFDGKVDLTNPEHKFQILIDYGTDQNKRDNKGEPQQIYFGRWVGWPIPFITAHCSWSKWVLHLPQCVDIIHVYGQIVGYKLQVRVWVSPGDE